MNKNVKSIFFITTLIILLTTLSAISATDLSNDTSSIIEQDAVSDVNVEKVSDTPITDINTKNIKEESENNDVNYYVSDENGLDTNDGTEDNPFKTVQTAINKTKVGRTNNIYINAGLYKGLGNTNLTVDGDKIINFIGDGQDLTEFDGEAGYDIYEGEFYWGSSENWYYYENETGNWFMNISSGKGKITIKNLSINHMYVIGEPGTYWHGDAANLYPYANLDNYANLEVNNVLFYQNYGGVGSAIRNNEKATLTVNNCEFTKNQKSSSSGNQGIIYNKGTATILNSNFHDNYARWGTILNDANMTIISSEFSKNIGYDGGSTYKYGAGVAFSSGDSDYYNQQNITGINTQIINSTFKGINQTSIYGKNGNLLVSGCEFINTTGIRIIDSTNSNNNKYIIENNVFDNIIGSDIDKSLSQTELKYFVLDLSIENDNLLINNNKISTNNGTIISTISGNITNNNIQVNSECIGIIINPSVNERNKTIENNTINANLTIKSNNTFVKNNIITGTKNYAVSVINYRECINNIISDNYLVSSDKFGDDAVNASEKNIVENNTPVLTSEYIYCLPDITEENQGTLENHTTIQDAISKVNNDQTIILLPGSTNTYFINSTININNQTVKENTTKFTIKALDKNTNIQYNLSSGICFNISSGFNVTFMHLSIKNSQSSTLSNTGEVNFINVDIVNNLVRGTLSK